MAFEGYLRLPLPADALSGHFPTLQTWLRLNPQWSLLTLKPAADPDCFEVRLRFDQDEREESFHVCVVPLGGKLGWRMNLLQEGAVRSIDLELAREAGPACELALRDATVADGDGLAQAQSALWLRATADYMLLSASRRRRARVGKWLLDHLWLRMNLTGRRVVVLILAYEAVGLALLIGWLVWERFAG